MLQPGRLRKNSRMYTPPWKSGPSGPVLSWSKEPRKTFAMTAGFSPSGRLPRQIEFFRSLLEHPIAMDDGDHSIPNSFASAFHFPSTSARVSGSITISSGQGRVKPSVDHLRVASIPIFDP